MACAITLQKEGRPNLVIEKRAFPRPKTCGGMVTEKTRAQLAELLSGLPESERQDEIFCAECRTLALWDGGKRLTRSEIEKPLRFVRRETFDAFLAEAYVHAGGELLEGRRAERLDAGERTLTLDSGESVRYRHLVAADGAMSETRAALGGRAPLLGFCVEAWIPADRFPLDEVRIDFGPAPTGYAWQFPSGDAVCVGLGGVYASEERYDGMLKEYLRTLGLDPDTFTLRGAFLPYGSTVDPRELPYGVLPVGDAGGFVDPVTGEGLYFALTTGMAAAGAILDGGNVTRSYARRTARLARLVRQGALVRRYLYGSGARDRFKRRIEGKNGFVGFYCDRQVSEYGKPYARLAELIPEYRKRKNDIMSTNGEDACETV